MNFSRNFGTIQEFPLQTVKIQYVSEKADQHCDQNKKDGKKHFAIMLENEVIGDIYLMNITPEISWEFGIHLVNDQYK